ncbi:hypothetical protein [Neptunitalea chrysea]|nr:hypothetical protein [Neptunitalea chrysea]
MKKNILTTVLVALVTITTAFSQENEELLNKAAAFTCDCFSKKM